MHLSGWVGVGFGGNCDCRCDDEISTSPCSLDILYKTLLARKLSKPEDGRYRPKHVIFPIANKHRHIAIYL